MFAHKFFPQRSWRPFFLSLVWIPKKGLHMFFCKGWAPFIEIKQRWAPFVPGFAVILPRFSGIFPGFLGIFPGFSTNQNFCVALAPPAPHLLHHCHWTTVDEHRKIFQSMEKGTRRFSQREKVLRLLLVSPSSSCTAEQSFSGRMRGQCPTEYFLCPPKLCCAQENIF